SSPATSAASPAIQIRNHIRWRSRRYLWALTGTRRQSLPPSRIILSPGWVNSFSSMGSSPSERDFWIDSMYDSFARTSHAFRAMHSDRDEEPPSKGKLWGGRE